MNADTATNPKPRRKRAARKTTKLVPAVAARPVPVRELGHEGARMWERIWDLRSAWISQVIDLDHITLLCESVDEREPLRAAVLEHGEWRDRVALRALDVQIASMMGALGLNPSERAKMNVDAAKGDESDPLTRMRARYASGR